MISTMQEYLNAVKGQTMAVIGIGVSNTPLIKLLLRAGISVTACDRSERNAFGLLADELESLGANLQFGQDYLKNLDQDVVFRSPGIRPDIPELLAVQERGGTVTSEMELFFQLCPCKIIGVTGSDGKTTTTTIIAELLKKAGYNTYLGGNIGKPLLADVEGMEPDDMVVVELSSFQLMTMSASPDIAVVTNLAPNHLDVHTSMGEYISAKENIFTHQTEQGIVVLNLDNEITKNFAGYAKGSSVMFSRQQVLERGVYVENDAIWFADDQSVRRVLPLSDILLPGVHNVENYMAAIAALNGLVSDRTICEFATTFGGVEHRIELVSKVDGVRYYNDSIASSPSRTIAGLHSFDQKVILIAGGYDKHIPFDQLGVEINDGVKHLVLVGDTAEKIKTAVEQAHNYQSHLLPITVVYTLNEAVATAKEGANEGDVVLLSPACASFDQFKNFAQRGEVFKEIVRQMEG